MPEQSTCVNNTESRLILITNGPPQGVVSSRHMGSRDRIWRSERCQGVHCELLDMLYRSQEHEACDVEVQDGRVFPPTYPRCYAISIPMQDVETVTGTVTPFGQGWYRRWPCLLCWARDLSRLLLRVRRPEGQLRLVLCAGFLVAPTYGKNQNARAEVTQVGR